MAAVTCKYPIRATRWWKVWLFAVFCVHVVLPAASQYVDEAWRTRTDEAIRELRTTPLRLLVLTANGRMAVGAQVRIEQLDHAFALGFVTGLRFPESFDPAAPVWRLFNAVSLDGITDWRLLQPRREMPADFAAIDAVLAAAEAHDLAARWGELIPGSPFNMPEWIAPLRDAALLDAARQWMQTVAERYGNRLSNLDTLGDVSEEGRFSPALIRLLALEQAAFWSALSPRLRMVGGIDGDQSFETLAHVDELLMQRLAIRGLTLQEAIAPQALEPDLVNAAILRVMRLSDDITVGSLDVAGHTGVQAAANLELVLRLLFAQPQVTGIYFGSVQGSSAGGAFLLDDAGQPTAAGRVVEDLFRRNWWTQETRQSNELGEVELRVFRGRYRITATLPDGAVVSIPVDCSKVQGLDDPIVLQPLP